MLAPLKQPLAVAGKRRAPTRKRRNKAVSPAVAAALSRSNEEAEAGTSTASASRPRLPPGKPAIPGGKPTAAPVDVAAIANGGGRQKTRPRNNSRGDVVPEVPRGDKPTVPLGDKPTIAVVTPQRRARGNSRGQPPPDLPTGKPSLDGAPAAKAGAKPKLSSKEKLARLRARKAGVKSARVTSTNTDGELAIPAVAGGDAKPKAKAKRRRARSRKRSATQGQIERGTAHLRAPPKRKRGPSKSKPKPPAKAKVTKPKSARVKSPTSLSAKPKAKRARGASRPAPPGDAKPKQRARGASRPAPAADDTPTAATPSKPVPVQPKRQRPRGGLRGGNPKLAGSKPTSRPVPPRNETPSAPPAEGSFFASVNDSTDAVVRRPSTKREPRRKERPSRDGGGGTAAATSATASSARSVGRSRRTERITLLKRIQALFNLSFDPSLIVDQGRVTVPLDAGSGSRSGRQAGGPPAPPSVFGQTLSDLLFREEKRVPYVVQSSVGHLIKVKAIEEEGIFRVSGAASEVRALRAAYEARQPGVHVDLSGVGDPNVVAAVLKAYLKDLPEPVIPFDYLDTFLDVARSGSPSPEWVARLQVLLELLPQQNRDLLELLLVFLALVALNEDTTRMSVANLSIVFAPNVLRGNNLSLQEEMLASKDVNKLMTFMVENVAALEFPQPRVSARPSGRTTTPLPSHTTAATSTATHGASSSNLSAPAKRGGGGRPRRQRPLSIAPMAATATDAAVTGGVDDVAEEVNFDEVNLDGLLDEDGLVRGPYLPAQWEIRWTNEGRPYYVDHINKLNHWHMPESTLAVCIANKARVDKARANPNAAGARDTPPAYEPPPYEPGGPVVATPSAPIYVAEPETSSASLGPGGVAVAAPVDRASTLFVRCYNCGTVLAVMDRSLNVGCPCGAVMKPP